MESAFLVRISSHTRIALASAKPGPHTFGMVFCGATLAWILHGVRSLSRSIRSNFLDSFLGRVYLSMIFIVLVVFILSAVASAGTAGYLLALITWTALHLIARAFL